MANDVLSALADGEVIQSNLLATVTRKCVIIPNSAGQACTIIAISRLRSVKRVKSTYPGLMVIAGGLALIAAAAGCSKEGHGSAVPIAVLGLGFAGSYVGTRRCWVSMVIASETMETVQTASGSIREATAIVEAIQQARNHQEREAA